MPSKACEMANARDAALGELARRAHMRNEAGVRSCLIANAMPRLHLSAQPQRANHSAPASGKQKSGVRDDARRYQETCARMSFRDSIDC